MEILIGVGVVMAVWAWVGWMVCRDLGASRVDAWSVLVFGLACQMVLVAWVLLGGFFFDVSG